jgi:hypothetical protein
VWMDMLSKEMGGVPVIFLRGTGQQLLSLAA